MILPPHLMPPAGDLIQLIRKEELPFMSFMFTDIFDTASMYSSYCLTSPPLADSSVVTALSLSIISDCEARSLTSSSGGCLAISACDISVTLFWRRFVQASASTSSCSFRNGFTISLRVGTAISGSELV